MPASQALKLETNVAVPMRDGTILYADIYRSGSGSALQSADPTWPMTRATPACASARDTGTR